MMVFVWCAERQGEQGHPHQNDKDKVNKDVLMRIKETFEKAVKGKAGRLNQDEFAAAFKGGSY
eukprot:561024-Pelagomonas_calceolata.AAC.3